MPLAAYFASYQVFICFLYSLSNQAEIAMCVNKTPHAAIYVLLLRGKDSLQKIIKNLSPITHSPTRDFPRARARARGLLACFVLVLYLVFTCFRCPQTQ